MEIDVVGDIQGRGRRERIDISIPEGITIDDPVRMYLKEIGKSTSIIFRRKK